MQKFKTKIVRNIGQSMADFIIKRLESTSTQEEFDFWFSMGVKLDDYCVVFHDIYLD